MDNLTKIRNTPHRKLREEKRKNNYNDSFNKKKNSFPSNIKIQKIDPTKKFQIALQNLKEGLEEIRAESLEKERQFQKEKKDIFYNKKYLRTSKL